MSDEHDGDDQAILPFDDGTFGRAVRQQWHDGRWFFSVVDAVAVLTDSTNPGTYWRVLKKRLADEGSEVVTKCNSLKMRAIDGKMRATDAADSETMLRIVQSIPSPKAEPFKMWLARVGAQKLDEAAATMTEAQKRLLLRGEVTVGNKSLNDAARAVGVLSGQDFAVFHDAGYRGLYKESAAQIAARKDVPKGKILDYMGSGELAMNWLRITQTDEQLRTQEIADKNVANETHFRVGHEIRMAVERIGGAMPETLTTPRESIQQLEQAAETETRARLQPPLFPDADDTADEDQ